MRCWRRFILTVIFGGALAFATSQSPSTATAGVVASGYHVGLVRCTFIDRTRSVLNYSTSPPSVLTRGRTLVTEVRYPTVGSASSSTEVANAAPASRIGGFPTIIFAHGYNVTPDTYATLLDTWVQRGFVVAAPLFPDENPAAITLQHLTNTESDLVNEPADVAFVTRQLIHDSVAATPTCPLISGLIDATSLALAGHSDGAEAVGMLSNSLGRDPQGVAFTTLREGLDYRAVIVMSGAENDAGTYRASVTRPDLLIVQSANDTCNAPKQSLRLYRDIGQNNKWFLELLRAHHLPPYDGEDGPAFTLVSGATIRFLQGALQASSHPDLIAFVNSQPSVARIFHSGSGPLIPPLMSPPHCGFH